MNQKMDRRVASWIWRVLNLWIAWLEGVPGQVKVGRRRATPLIGSIIGEDRPIMDDLLGSVGGMPPDTLAAITAYDAIAERIERASEAVTMRLTDELRALRPSVVCPEILACRAVNHEPDPEERDVERAMALRRGADVEALDAMAQELAVLSPKLLAELKRLRARLVEEHDVPPAPVADLMGR